MFYQGSKMDIKDNLTIKLHKNDNVAIAFNDISVGQKTLKIKATNHIPKGHKIALKKIKKGESIIKYDQIIGLAGKDISAGNHVHTENTEFIFSNHNYQFSTSVKLPNLVPKNLRKCFNGYRRQNGKVGTRNYIGVLTSVNCSATAAKNIASFFDIEKLSRFFALHHMPQRTLKHFSNFDRHSKAFFKT